MGDTRTNVCFASGTAFSSPHVERMKQLLTGAREEGLSAKRSPHKILNHLETAVDHDAIARALGLHHKADPPQWWLANRALLARELSHGVAGPLPIFGALPGKLRFLAARFPQLVDALVRNAQEFGHPLSRAQVLALLHSFYTAAQIEFHPCDICNHSCRGCTYAHDDPELKPDPICFPFRRLDAIAAFDPKSLVFAGGGEPELYKDPATGKTFPDLVAELRRLLPDCHFGLITNGTRYAGVPWFNEFRWVRFSIDAATPATYRTHRGRDDFDKVCSNLVDLLARTNVPQVNVGFVFYAGNIHEAPQAARYFYDLVNTHCPEALGRLYIDYRPLRRDPKDLARDFPESVSGAQIAQACEEFLSLASDPWFASFLRTNTNCVSILDGHTHDRTGFTRCDYSSIYRLIRANGDVRPCCMRLAEPEFDLGNILCDAQALIALRILVNAAFLLPGCDAAGCKLARLNRTATDGIEGRLAPSTDPAIAGNRFF